MKTLKCQRCTHRLCARKVPMFSTLPEDDLRVIVQMTGHRAYDKGETLIHEGDELSTLFIVNTGKVKISSYTADGKEQILHFLQDGDFFGELSIFTPETACGFTATAMSQVNICTLTKDQMDRLLLQHPTIGQKLLAELALRLQKVERLAQILATNDAQQRLILLLLELAHQYGEEKDGATVIQLPMSREVMGNSIGLTRETISRKLNGLQEAGLIEQRGNKTIIIPDKDALQTHF